MMLTIELNIIMLLGSLKKQCHIMYVQCGPH